MTPIGPIRSLSTIPEHLSPLEGWVLMVDELPPSTGLYITWDNTSIPQKRILRWSGENWYVIGITTAPNVIAWKEMDDSPSTSIDEEEPCPVCGPDGPDLSQIIIR